jgi:hypothetical protein
MDGVGDIDEMLEKLGREVLEDVIEQRQFHRNAHHVERKGRDRGGAVRLVEVTASQQRLSQIKQPDIVEAEEAALKDVAPVVPRGWLARDVPLCCPGRARARSRPIARS